MACARFPCFVLSYFMTAAALSLIAFCTFLTAILSGVFGMAGGMIMMVLLLGLLPVTAAMALHAAIQLTANGWRCWLWREHIVWRVLPVYAAGILTGFVVMSLVHYVPSRAAALLVLGAVPLAAIAAEKHVRLSILNPGQTFATAVCLTFIQLTAGVVGPLLDLLYNNAPLTRQQIISTKAFTQGTMHLLRLGYFGFLIPVLGGQGIGWPAGIPPAALALCMALAVAGTSFAALIVKRMSDQSFKALSRWLILAISLWCLGQGVWLLVGG